MDKTCCITENITVLHNKKFDTSSVKLVVCCYYIPSAYFLAIPSVHASLKMFIP